MSKKIEDEFQPGAGVCRCTRQIDSSNTDFYPIEHSLHSVSLCYKFVRQTTSTFKFYVIGMKIDIYDLHEAMMCNMYAKTLNGNVRVRR